MLAYGDGGGGDDEDDDDEFTLNARIENKKSGNVMSLTMFDASSPKVVYLLLSCIISFSLSNNLSRSQGSNTSYRSYLPLRGS